MKPKARKTLPNIPTKPRFYEITNGKQFLFVLGTAHLYDITHPQFKFIQNKWKDFLKKTDKQDCIVLVEGGKRLVIKGLKEATSQAAEGGFITSLASKEDIDSTSPEPPDKYEVNKLLKKFTKDQIMFYYFSRLVVQWFNTGKLLRFRNYIQRYFDNYKRLLRWDYDFSIDHFIEIHDKRRGHKFDEEDCVHCLYQFDFDIKDVENSSVKIRDGYILNKILKLWAGGYNIFAVYGGTHTENWERRLKKLDEATD